MAGPAAIINPVSGAPQTVFTGIQLSAPLVAQVVDANGSPVNGVTVTFAQRGGGNGAGVSFAGGVNTAVTNAQGLATSAVMTANGIAGDFFVDAWVGTGPVAGAVGPATFRLTSSASGPITNRAAIPAAWTTAKAALATVQTDLATLATDLGTFEAACDALYNLGAGDVVDWLRKNATQTRVGYQPRVGAGGNTAPPVLAVWAPDTTHARDTTGVDQRPISSTQTGGTLGLS